MCKAKRITSLIVAVVAVVTTASVWADVEYTLVDLNELADPCVIFPSVGYGINDLGVVTGHGYPNDPCASANPFVVDTRTMTYINLGDMEGGLASPTLTGNGYGINNCGWVVGRNMAGDGYYRAFLWIDDNGDNLSDPCELRDIGFEAPYTWAYAWDVSNAGHVAGFDGYQDASDSYRRGWVWQDTNGNRQVDAGEKIDFGDYQPTSVNSAGQATVNYDDQAYLWQDTDGEGDFDVAELIHLPNSAPTYPGHDTSAKQVNEVGQVMGSADNQVGAAQGFVWTNANGNNVAELSEFASYGTLWKQTHSRDLNDVGVVVGGTYHYPIPDGTNRHAFMWDPVNGMRDLNSLIPDYSLPGMGTFRLSQAEAINNKGQIVVTGWFDNNGDDKRGTSDPEHVMLLNPIIKGDLDGDLDVDLVDFALFSQDWMHGVVTTPCSL